MNLKMNGNHRMKKGLLALASSASLLAPCALRALDAKPAQAAKKPNVIFIFTDDQDLLETGCYGGRVLTPNIDRLAREGMKFNKGYITSPVCTPSRHTALTGRPALNFINN